MLGIALAKQVHSRHSVDVKQEGKQQADITHCAQAFEQRADQELQFGQDSNQAEEPQHTRKPENHRNLGIHRQTAQHHNYEIKDTANASNGAIL